MNEKSRSRKYWKRCLQVVVISLIFFFLGYNLYNYWGELATYSWEPDLLFLGISFILTLCCSFLVALGWSFILRVLGRNVDHLRALRVYFLGELGRYIPGNIWGFVGRIYMAEKEGVPKTITTASIAVQLLVQLIAAMMVALLTLPFWDVLEIKHTYCYFFLLIPAGLVVLHPAIFGRLLNFILVRFKKTSFNEKLCYRNIILLVVYWVGLWLLKGAASYFLLRAIYRQPLPAFSLIIMIGLTALAWTLTTLSFIAPAGLGILEGITYVFVKTLLGIGPGIASVFVLLSRLWIIVVELVCVAIVLLVNIIVRSPDSTVREYRPRCGSGTSSRRD